MGLFTDNTIMDMAISIFLRDVCMMLGVGFAFVFYYVLIRKKESLEIIGITKNKLKRSLCLNIVFAIALLLQFMSAGEKLVFNRETLYAIVYIFAAGIFEMVFIYGFLRCFFERAFGIIPAIILTAICYSLHHAGFQPEFGKLFFVGIMYVVVFYFTKNIFVIFPFFWGVGAIWDVLVQSTAGESLTSFTYFMVGLIVLVLMIVISLYYNKLIEKTKAN